MNDISILVSYFYLFLFPSYFFFWPGQPFFALRGPLLGGHRKKEDGGRDVNSGHLILAAKRRVKNVPLFAHLQDQKSFLPFTRRSFDAVKLGRPLSMLKFAPQSLTALVVLEFLSRSCCPFWIMRPPVGPPAVRSSPFCPFGIDWSRKGKEKRELSPPPPPLSSVGGAPLFGRWRRKKKPRGGNEGERKT